MMNLRTVLLNIYEVFYLKADLTGWQFNSLITININKWIIVLKKKTENMFCCSYVRM